MSLLGNAVAVGQIALQSLIIKPRRGFRTGFDGPLFVADVTIEEVHTNELEITDHPVEQGATISDHAFLRPAELVITAGWSDSPNKSGPLNQLLGAAANSNAALKAVIGAAELVGGIVNMLGPSSGASPSQKAYWHLLDMQRGRTLFTIYTAKKTYRNMIIKSLAATTDQKTENSAIARIGCREILMAVTQTVTVPDSSVMANPAQNGATVNKGVQYPLPSATYNVG